MKKLLFASVLALVAVTVFAQESTKVNADTTKTVDKVDGKNDITLNILNTLFSLPEISYERILSNNTGLGIVAMVGVGRNIDYKYNFIAYYRMYFSDKQGCGFFIEGNGIVNWSYDIENTVVYYNMEGEKYFGSRGNRTDVGLGMAIGSKFLTKNGFIGEIYAGVGRFIGSELGVKVYPRVGINVGKRF